MAFFFFFSVPNVVLLFQFSYEDRIFKSKNHSCCKLLPVLCWRHCLKTVQIEYYGEDIGKETLNRYFFKNSETCILWIA